MAGVVFAFGSKPGLSASEAVELAELLARRRNLAAVSAAGKILAQAQLDPDREPSTDVELDLAEIGQLVEALGDVDLADSDAWLHLRAEALSELG